MLISLSKLAYKSIFICSEQVTILLRLWLVFDTLYDFGFFFLIILIGISLLVSGVLMQVQLLCSFLSHKKSARVQETSLRCLWFLFTKGSCQFTNMACIVRILVDALDEDMLPTTSHCDALRLLRKVIPVLIWMNLCLYFDLEIC